MVIEVRSSSLIKSTLAVPTGVELVAQGGAISSISGELRSAVRARHDRFLNSLLKILFRPHVEVQQSQIGSLLTVEYRPLDDLERSLSSLERSFCTHQLLWGSECGIRIQKEDYGGWEYRLSK